MSNMSETNSSFNRSDDSSITFKSPFSKFISLLDENVPDLELVIPGVETPFCVHRRVLHTSSTLEDLFSTISSSYCIYDKNRKVAQLKLVNGESDASYRNVLVKWLRFCYGENQTFNGNECTDAFVVLLQLQLKDEDEVKEKLISFIESLSTKDLEMGLKISHTLLDEYCDINDDRIKEFGKRIEDLLKDETKRNSVLDGKYNFESEFRIRWKQTAKGEEFESFCKMLMTNAIPTKSLNLCCL